MENSGKHITFVSDRIYLAEYCPVFVITVGRIIGLTVIGFCINILERIMKIDEKDAGILRLLQENDRTTVKEMAEKINLSSSPTFDRQKRLERNGVIMKYAAVIDSRKVGNHLIVLCNISLKEQNNTCSSEFVKDIMALDEVVECYNISGDYDYVAKIYLRDMNHYEDFVNNRLGAIKSIRRFHSIFVISEVKNSHSVPVYPEEQ